MGEAFRMPDAPGGVVYRLRANEIHARHSEGSFLRLRDGRILYAYSLFSGSAGDDDPSNIAVVTSADEGSTWTEPRIVLRAEDFGTHNIMSVSLIRRLDGSIGLFFGGRMVSTQSHHFMAVSTDEGETFGRIVSCTLPDRGGYYVLNNDRVIRLRSGRLIMPLAYHRGGCGFYREDPVYFESRSYATFRISDDDGETWHEAADIVTPPFGDTFTGLQEPGVVELANGVLFGWCRTDKMYQYCFRSFDQGEHWTAAEPSQFTSPDSPLQIRKSPEDGTLLAVWNPIPNFNGRYIYPGTNGRTPIACARSFDDGVSWTKPYLLEGDDRSGYCYPAILFTGNGEALISYSCGWQKNKYCPGDTAFFRLRYQEIPREVRTRSFFAPVSEDMKP